MLGFSDEDKQRIGGAQQGTGKGVVRGVLGLPGRLVGGIWGGGSAEANANMASDNQVSFTSSMIVNRHSRCFCMFFIQFILVSVPKGCTTVCLRFLSIVKPNE